MPSSSTDSGDGRDAVVAMAHSQEVVHEGGQPYPAMDRHAVRTWHFPLNNEKRPYQFDMIRECLFKNTLVALPTGLGKTFIAAIAMYNYYRWFPTGTIVFLAPTRPLVTQQMTATLGTVEIDPAVTVELTGGQDPEQRKVLWKQSRVVFLTPQVLENDLATGICDSKRIVMLVFDEAHKALGNHAYCNVVRMASEHIHRDRIRILALTATPGSNVATVQDIIENLALSEIIIRTESSPDVQPFVYDRAIEIIVVPESAEIQFIRKQFETLIIKPYLEKLHEFQVLSERDPSRLSSFRILEARKAMRAKGITNGAAEGIFAALASVYHAYELLLFHGITSFQENLTKASAKELTLQQSRLRGELLANPSFPQLMAYVDAQKSSPSYVSHPKMGDVVRILVQHFTDHAEDSKETRAIVFSQYRESVHEIVEKLALHAPLIRVMSFVGQTSATKTREQITQKQQIEVLERFRNGGYNVLVATCIGEEGLDIGNVDLILCFDMQSSPIRMLQRIGRTGRHRDGKIVLLLSAGKEEQRHKQTITQHRSVQKAIKNAKETFSFFTPTRTALPRSSTACVERHFDVSSNLAFLESRTEGQRRSTARGVGKTARSKASISLHQITSVFDTITQNQFDAVSSPSLEKHPTWQRTAGPYFLVSHSATTERLVELYAQFDDLDQLPSPLIRRSDFAPEIRVNPQGPLSGSPKEVGQVDIGSLHSRMRQAIEQMTRRSNHPEDNLKPWAEYQRSFSVLLSPPNVTASIYSGPTEAAPTAALHQPIAIPDDFFDDMDDEFGPNIRIDLRGEVEPNENEPALLNDLALNPDLLAGIEGDFFESSPGTMSKCSRREQPKELALLEDDAPPRAVERGTDRAGTSRAAVEGEAVPISSTSDISPVRASLVTPLESMRLESTNSATETASSCELLEGCPKSLVDEIIAPSRRRNVTIETSSPDAARLTKRQHSPSRLHDSKRGPPSKRYARSKFVLSEAPCSEEDSGEGTDDNCSEDSSGMADFIDDRSNSDWTRSGGDPSQSSDATKGNETPSTGEMMAFYRQTAHHSQPDPRFHGNPRQFAVRRRMNPTGRRGKGGAGAPLCDGKGPTITSASTPAPRQEADESSQEDKNDTPTEDTLLLPCDWSHCFAA